MGQRVNYGSWWRYSWQRLYGTEHSGLGGRAHPQIAWAKLEALAAGTALATKLWR